MELFAEALEKPPEDRDAFLRDRCTDDESLLLRIRRLIEVHQESQVILPDRSHRTMGTLSDERPGTLIGRYKLLEQIGEGGFGVVFMAEQQEPVRRKVALKIIKAGMDTRQVIARFEAERQALALMDHPNIAKVLDAGATDTGRPYFVMELVQGVPITQFCEDHQLSVKERIELFLPVCQAIQHAHQKGVIHRDLKPSNVLVTRDDPAAAGHAIVIDFGVAKAIDQRLTEKTLHTNFARMIGTPVYMSPEQAEMSKQDVDTRSDVYSLGILLYELLTCTTPFPEERLKTVSYAELQRIIIEEEPQRPSTTLSGLNGQFRKVAANRRCEPATLMKLVRGDLDWVVLKAIEKDRNRRYATPLELAADLQRYLENEPITARPPSTAYKVQKFIRRNRTVAVATLAVLLALLTGVITTSWQAAEAKRERANAEQQAATASAALGFIQEDLFQRARFQPDIKLVDAMEAAVSQVGDGYQDEPLVEAAIQLTIGKGYRHLGNYRRAKEHLSRSIELHSHILGPEADETLEGKQELAHAALVLSEYEQAEALIDEVLASRMERLEPDAVEALVGRRKEVPELDPPGSGRSLRGAGRPGTGQGRGLLQAVGVARHAAEADEVTVIAVRREGEERGIYDCLGDISGALAACHREITAHIQIAAPHSQRPHIAVHSRAQRAPTAPVPLGDAIGRRATCHRERAPRIQVRARQRQRIDRAVHSRAQRAPAAPVPLGDIIGRHAACHR